MEFDLLNQPCYNYLMFYSEIRLMRLLKSSGIDVEGVDYVHNILFSKLNQDLHGVQHDTEGAFALGESVVYISWPRSLIFRGPSDKEKLIQWLNRHSSFVEFIIDILKSRFVLLSINDLIKSLGDVRDYYEIYSRIISDICKLTYSTIGALTVYDKSSNMLFGKASGYINTELHGNVDIENYFNFPLIPDTAAATALELRDILVINDTWSERRILKKFVEYYKVARVIVVPLFVEEELFGFIYLGRFQGLPSYVDDDIEVLRISIPYLLGVLKLLRYQEDSIRRLKALLFVKTLSEDILTETNLGKIFDIAREYCKEILKMENCAFFKFDEMELHLLYNHGFNRKDLDRFEIRNECLRELVKFNTEEQLRFGCINKSVANECGYKLLLTIPLIIDTRPEIIALIGSKSKEIMSSEDVEYVKVLWNSLGIAMKNLSLYEKSVETLDRIIDVLSQLESKKDIFTASHSRDVAEFSLRIAEKLGLTSEEKKNIYLAGLLHDIGKVIVEKSILLKDGPLNDVEWEEIKGHPNIGKEILKSVPGLEQVSIYVESHHERFDGTGYPLGLRGKGIPLGARILGIADAVVTMRSDRPYRGALNREQVIHELKREQGKQFDPDLVEIVIKILEEQEQFDQKFQ